MNQNDFIRQESKGIVDDTLSFTKKYIKHKTIFSIIFPIAKKRMDEIILYEASMEDVRAVLLMIKKRVDKLYKMIDTVEALHDTKTDPVIRKKVEDMPGFKKLLELFEDGN